MTMEIRSVVWDTAPNYQHRVTVYGRRRKVLIRKFFNLVEESGEYFRAARDVMAAQLRGETVDG